MPVDRETGRPRGFAFVEFTDRTAADEVIRKFDAQPFQGRNLAVSEARAREDRPPSARPPGGGFGGPRPGGFSGPRPGGGGFGGGGFTPRPPGGGFPPGPGGRDRSANFGPPAPPKRLRGAKKSSQQEHKPKGPIKEKGGGRIYAVDDLEDDTSIDIDNVATRAPDGDDAADLVTQDDAADRAPQDDETDD
jgi:RNA recognition motif-containing protein